MYPSDMSEGLYRVFVDLGEHLFPFIHYFRKITDFVVQVSHQKITLFLKFLLPGHSP